MHDSALYALYTYISVIRIGKDKTGGACCTRQKPLRERSCLEDLDIDGGMLLKLILGKQNRCMYAVFGSG